MYSLEIAPSCKKNIAKLCSKNNELRKAIENKIEEIVQFPEHYKPLKHDLKNERRVHIMKSFVLRFEIDEDAEIVTLISFGHHDDAYKRK